jgi:hypothetical protein
MFALIAGLASLPIVGLKSARAAYEIALIRRCAMPFDAERAGGYFMGALVASASGRIWVSRIDGNMSDPDIDATDWTEIRAARRT